MKNRQDLDRNLKSAKQQVKRAGRQIVKEYEDLTFSINPQDVDECHDVSPREYATYDILTDKIWIWLFRINKMAIDCLASEDNVICNIIYNIEHEWIHRLDVECIGEKRYLNLNREVVELRVRLQQSRGFKNE